MEGLMEGLMFKPNPNLLWEKSANGGRVITASKESKLVRKDWIQSPSISLPADDHSPVAGVMTKVGFEGNPSWSSLAASKLTLVVSRQNCASVIGG